MPYVDRLAKLDQFLSLIEDGVWHSFENLSKQSSIPKPKLAAVSKLLSEASIVEYEPKKSQVRIRNEWKQLLKKQLDERKSERAAVGTFVLPPESSLNVQGIKITNLTDEELELNVRVNRRLKELAIGKMIDFSKST